ncbi:GT2 family glycosyltransferase [Lutibacter sp. Hel_I_33_5]|uniref:glycosyltransferase family 2 protein n=1 Tax=Lutibacter sp. Hel_I_33_5 TaxID=1566289 RepID=UPI0011A45903|nr:glycosyltransferase [Lutibacter sp. Hel_I_33_5]TVZ55489.1 GT2 family glycosyltransferase [Lutibacter sp. Hel_I_33_5]
MPNKEKTPFVSVVLTTYNRKELLKETIDSILDQTFVDFELIVIDNYSNYDFIEYMKSFNDDRIRFYQNQNEGVIAVNRNYAIKKAKGEYIAFCDDDDIWDKEKVKLQVAQILKKPDTILVSTNFSLINDKSSKLKTSLSKKIKYLIISKFKNPKFSLSYMNYIIFSSVLIKKQNILFSENVELIGTEDFEFNLRLSFLKGNFSFINKELVKYRIHSNANSYKGRIEFVSRFIEVIEKNKLNLTLTQKYFFIFRKKIFKFLKY